MTQQEARLLRAVMVIKEGGSYQDYKDALLGISRKKEIKVAMKIEVKEQLWTGKR